MAYSNKVTQRFENPNNIGSFPEGDLDVGTGLVGAPACGDVMKLQIKIKDGKIVQLVHKTFGCQAAMASSEYLTEIAEGLTLEDAAKITNQQIADELALPPVKIHCSVLAKDAIAAAVKDWESKQQPGVAMDGIGTGDRALLQDTTVVVTQ